MTMREFFKNIFSKKDNSVKKEEKSPLEILEYAISDAGLFTWYSADLPKYAQLEFSRTMLYFDPKDDQSPPSNQIALQFGNVKSVYLFKDDESKLPNNWLDLLTEDKLEPFDINYEYFSFDDNEIQKMISEFRNSEKIYGENFMNVNQNENFKIGFKAGEISIVLVSEKMKIMTHSGEMKFESIPEIHNEWWSYWRKYWELIDSEDKLPYDPICEITIPAGRFKMN